jgi:hypothetical protein
MTSRNFIKLYLLGKSVKNVFKTLIIRRKTNLDNLNKNHVKKCVLKIFKKKYLTRNQSYTSDGKIVRMNFLNYSRDEPDELVIVVIVLICSRKKFGKITSTIFFGQNFGHRSKKRLTTP